MFNQGQHGECYQFAIACLLAKSQSELSYEIMQHMFCELLVLGLISTQLHSVNHLNPGPL